MTTDIPSNDPSATDDETLQESVPPACVMTFNAGDPSGAGGTAADVATVAAMGAHALPIITTIVMRDTAECMDAETVSCPKAAPLKPRRLAASLTSS